MNDGDDHDGDEVEDGDDDDLDADDDDDGVDDNVGDRRCRGAIEIPERSAASP